MDHHTNDPWSKNQVHNRQEKERPTDCIHDCKFPPLQVVDATESAYPKEHSKTREKKQSRNDYKKQIHVTTIKKISIDIPQNLAANFQSFSSTSNSSVNSTFMPEVTSVMKDSVKSNLVIASIQLLGLS